MIRSLGLSLFIHIAVLALVMVIQWQKNPHRSTPRWVEIYAYDPTGEDEVVAATPLKSLKKSEAARKPSPNIETSKTAPQGAGESSSTEEKRPRGQAGTARVTYEQELHHFIAQNRFYPRQALALEQTGVVKVRLKINPSGEFFDIHIVEESEFPLLNKAALELLLKLKSFKPLPKQAVGRNDFIIPIHYQLNQ